jgi:hypothetical protein
VICLWPASDSYNHHINQETLPNSNTQTATEKADHFQHVVVVVVVSQAIGAIERKWFTC